MYVPRRFHSSSLHSLPPAPPICYPHCNYVSWEWSECGGLSDCIPTHSIHLPHHIMHLIVPLHSTAHLLVLRFHMYTLASMGLSPLYPLQKLAKSLTFVSSSQTCIRGGNVYATSKHPSSSQRMCSAPTGARCQSQAHARHSKSQPLRT